MTFSGDIRQDVLRDTAIPADMILGTTSPTPLSLTNAIGIARSNARQLESTKTGMRRQLTFSFLTLDLFSSSDLCLALLPLCFSLTLQRRWWESRRVPPIGCSKICTNRFLRNPLLCDPPSQATFSNIAPSWWRLEIGLVPWPWPHGSPSLPSPPQLINALVSPLNSGKN
jgi:hypothetical protein